MKYVKGCSLPMATIIFEVPDDDPRPALVEGELLWPDDDGEDEDEGEPRERPALPPLPPEIEDELSAMARRNEEQYWRWQAEGYARWKAGHAEREAERAKREWHEALRAKYFGPDSGPNR